MLELPSDRIPIGRQKWRTLQEKNVCNHRIGDEIQLTLSQCYPGKFTCGSGICIPLEERCNIKLNCEDQSDEKDCAGIDIGAEYLKDKIPISVKTEPTIIYVNVSILAFPSISTKDAKFSVDFDLNLRWYDLRINMQNLDENSFKNSLTKEELDALWMPKLSFKNSLSQLYSIRPHKGLIIKESNPLKEDIFLPNEGN